MTYIKAKLPASLLESFPAMTTIQSFSIEILTARLASSPTMANSMTIISSNTPSWPSHISAMASR